MKNIEYTYTTRLAFYIYLCANLFCCFYFYYTGYLGGDLSGYNIKVNYYLLPISLFIVIFTFVFYQYVIYPIFNNVKFNGIKYVNSKSLDFLILIINIFGLYSSVFYGVGVLGIEQNNSIPVFLNQFTVILQPINLVLIYFFYRASFSKKIVLLNLSIYAIYVVLSGQTVQLLVLFFLWVFIKKKEGKISSSKILIFISIGLIVYPFIRMLKMAVILSHLRGESLSFIYFDMLENGGFEQYFKFFFITLERFQIVANIQYILDNNNYLYNSYSVLNHGVGELLGNFWIFVFISKVFSVTSVSFISPQTFLASIINGSDLWASHIGIIGYFVFYGVGAFFVLILSVILVLSVSLLCSYLYTDKRVSLLGWLLTLQLLCHGWIFAYLYFLQTLIIFIFILKMINLKYEFIRGI
ncbi:oligosaccharide repeat unit polymerase [Photobacterium piscicola]|uniref:oligosaccharide repeat unit polymerase n=1 Tax=Photobacterium piscicola TaxID=1378299 RepID=UPI002E19A674|nr:oligosaccharide repeat unit polymerase [Photobacterium piscicola]